MLVVIPGAPDDVVYHLDQQVSEKDHLIERERVEVAPIMDRFGLEDGSVETCGPDYVGFILVGELKLCIG